MEELMYLLLGFTPLFIGVIITIIDNDKVNYSTEEIENWFRRNKASNSQKQHWFRRFILRPLFFTFVKFFDWTDSFKNRGLKNGIRITLTILLVIFWITLISFLAFFGFQIFIIGIVLIAIWSVVKGKFGIGENTVQNDKYYQEKENGRPLANVSGSEVVNSKTGEFEKDGFFGKEKIGKKIDLETGEIFTKGIFGWDKTGIKVDQTTGVIQEDGLFGYTNTKLRINPETGIIEEEGLMGWSDTKFRIDPKTGRKQKNDFLGWSDF